MSFSINHYYGEQKSKCGYCKGKECSIAHGMHSFTMSTKDYQDLIDRGWRRSGHYLYKPNNKKTCCPLYTIKCDAIEFKLSKSHKKILKRMNRFLRDGKREKNEEQLTLKKNENLEFVHDIEGEIVHEPVQPQVPIPLVNLSVATADHEQTLIQEDPRKITDILHSPCKKAKQMRLERKRAKLSAKGIEISNATLVTKMSNKEKTLSDFLNDTGSNDKHKLNLELVGVKSNRFKDTLETTYALYQKYQTIIHNDPPKNQKDYLEFLQLSPLQHLNTSDGPPDGYGSFHQQYWLDDKLIAVAVIDILPYCISSVYFFYDPDYSFLSLGTYGSLREIEFVQQLSKTLPTLKYYYMGFYIHTCAKMRYKGKLIPSYLLCPETYKWILLTDEIRGMLDSKKYQRLDLNNVDKDEDSFQPSDMDMVLLLVENTKWISYRSYIQITGNDDDRDSIIEYGELVGKSCAHRMLYWMM